MLGYDENAKSYEEKKRMSFCTPIRSHHTCHRNTLLNMFKVMRHVIFQLEEKKTSILNMNAIYIRNIYTI